MWDTLRLSAIGKLLGSKVAVLLVAVIMSAFLVAATPVSTTYAADVSWNGNNLSYGGQNYTQKTLVLPGTDSTSQIYVSDSDPTKVIIIPGGADTSKEVANAQEITYTVDQNGTYSNPTGRKTISIDAKTDGTAEDKNNPDKKNKTSCAVNGVGWIVCSMSKFLAGAMDKAYSWITEFLVIKPLTTDTESGLFQTWNIARGLANACFIVAFLIIIYSQITSYGISNYEIKKMIPRLIIAAVLVNVSYYICAAAVDVSNILGDSIAKALTEIRQSLPGPNAQVTWDNLTATILSGGTIVALPYAIGTAGGLAALVPLLAPILVGGILSILVAVMVLAARQALVIVLVVLAPLAFVAYLLPNTEKMFSKWREIFMNMLVIFPLFSLLFGGAQLASSIIIQSTDKMSVVLLAMFVQVAPLMITPFLMRVSHNLLTQVGGFVNNPRKGLVDRTRGWANEHSQMARDRYRAQGANKSGLRALGPKAVSYNLAKGRMNRQGAMKVYQDQIAAAVAQDKRAQALLADGKAAALKKDAGDALGERLFEQRKAADTQEGRNLQHYSGIQHLAQSQTKTLQTQDEAFWNAATTGAAPAGSRYASLGHDAHIAHTEHEIAESNAAIAQALGKKQFADALANDVTLQARVGSVDPHGQTKVIAKAKSASYAAKAEIVKDIENASDIMPGRTIEMVSELERGIRDGEVETVRAMINKLAQSANQGTIALRDAIERNENALTTAGMLEEVKFHIDSHQGLNNDAEDLVSWSRQQRLLNTVSNDPGIWNNMTANKFMAQKQSSQEIGLSTGGITQSTLRDIMRNPGKTNVKPAVLREIRRQLGINPDGSEDHTII